MSNPPTQKVRVSFGCGSCLSVVFLIFCALWLLGSAPVLFWLIVAAFVGLVIYGVVKRTGNPPK